MTPHRPAPPQLLTRRALADQVYDRLIADLVDGRIEPDSAISIGGLARGLGVPQSPIREALGRLEATGLVTRLPFKGYRAAPPLSLEDLRQLSEARRVIEPANARLAAAAATAELCEALEGDVADLERAPRGRRSPTSGSTGRPTNGSTGASPSTPGTPTCTGRTAPWGASCSAT